MARQKATRANGQATQVRVIEAATNMFATSGYEATSLRQIAAAAAIDIATLKYHFADKQALFGEIYRIGHHEFLGVISPFLNELEAVQSREALSVLVDDFVVAMHDFIESSLPFVRMTLFRMLEGSEDVIVLEEELQVLAISQIDSKFRSLIDRGLVEDFDTRAFVVFLVASFSTWHITGRVKPHWLEKPGLDTKSGRARSEAFFISLFEKFLGLSTLR